MNIIHCYAPTNGSIYWNKDQFHQIIVKFLEKHLSILMWDSNDKVWMGKNGYEYIMERHRLGKGNENGKTLLV